MARLNFRSFTLLACSVALGLAIFTSPIFAQQAASAAAGLAAGTPSSSPGPDDFYKLGPDSMQREGVPHGKIIGPTILPSEVFPGTQHTVWIYVPAQYDASKPTALMVFNDGPAMMAPEGDVRAQNVMDNLIYRREIPVMIGVFVTPGWWPGKQEPSTKEWGDRTANRPQEYNELNDKYPRVVVDEVLPLVTKDYNISKDPDQHGIGGASSGGIAAFTVAWERPEYFHKVFTIVGSFVDLRGPGSGSSYPDKVLAADKKPIRIFLQDGRNDNRNSPPNHSRDWFYQNVRMVDALTKKGYEVNYTWGIGKHGQKEGGAILPEMLRWLWRDQVISTDPADNAERAYRAAVPQASAEAAADGSSKAASDAGAAASKTEKGP